MKRVKVAGDLYYPPYEFIDTSGNYCGYNVEMMRTVGAQMGVALEFCPMDWEQAQTALLKGEVDVIQGMNYSSSRAEEFLFCLPLMMNNQAIFVPNYLKELRSLSDKIIGVQEGDISEDIIAGINCAAIKKFPSHREGIETLVTGRIDAFIGNETTVLCLLASMNRANDFKPLYSIYETRAYCTVVRKEDRQTFQIFNDGLSQFLRSTNKNAAVFKYMGEQEKRLLQIADATTIVGSSTAIKEVKGIINKVCSVDSTVMILGETGTGKELVARQIHENGPRRNKPFEVVNCSALPVTLLESELFGHEKGAFTGATSRLPGKFIQANGGTLFLDEVGDMEPLIQAKLLRVLQDKVVSPIGATYSRKTDVRVIAATNKDLPQEVTQGRFRRDLYYRLNVIDICVPPLRERREDIPLLCEYIQNKIANRFGCRKKHLSLPVTFFLHEYYFPGNVRELENILERAYVLSESDVIKMGDLPAYLFHETVKDSRKTINEGIFIFCGESLEQIEQKIILSYLKGLKKSKKETAEILGISERTLRNKVKTYF